LEVIDQAYARKKGIFFFNSPEGNRDAVAEHAVGMLLGLLNNISKADREVRNNLWNREPNRGTELGGKTVGIIGYGNTGSAFAKRLVGFGVQILAYDKYKTGFATETVQECSMEDVFAKADIISLHVQLTDETRYLVDRAFIEQFKKPIYLVNTSRGMVVNTHDLVWALGEDKILGAALDVLEQEKLDKLTLQQRANLDVLQQNNKVLLTPHIAGWTHESKQKIAELILYKLKDFAGGN
jgi:D-3-phosphoglycerate dehydrogenase